MIYCNNAAASFPKPKCVAEAVLRSLRSPEREAGRSAFAGSEDEIDRLRAQSAGLFGFRDREKVVLCPGATHALNLAIRGRALKLRSEKGGKPRVVSTMAEHNSVLRPLFHLLHEGLIELRLCRLAPDGSIDYGSLLPLLRCCDIAVVTAASNVTGDATDLEAVAGAAKSCGAFLIVDAAQSAGALETADYAALGVNAVAFAGHKYLLGPSGIGGLVYRGDLPFYPIVHGGTGVHSQSLLQPALAPFAYEAGTHNPCASSGLLAALDYRRSPEFRAVSGAGQALASQFRTWLKGNAKMRVLGAENPPARTPVVSFSVSGWVADDVGHLLWDNAAIQCRTGLHCAPLLHREAGLPHGSVRISFSVFSTDEDLSALIGVLEKF